VLFWAPTLAPQHRAFHRRTAIGSLMSGSLSSRELTRRGLEELLISLPDLCSPSYANPTVVKRSEGVGERLITNLKCLCRKHHLLKTFLGWRDEQLRDGTIVWTSPSGQRYVTTAGSALIFPDLCRPTCAITVGPRRAQACGDRSVTMPRRRRTREQNRAAAITAERHRNKHQRLEKSGHIGYFKYDGRFTVAQDADPPPF
jgi:hypothetical protein